MSSYGKFLASLSGVALFVKSAFLLSESVATSSPGNQSQQIDPHGMEPPLPPAGGLASYWGFRPNSSISQPGLPTPTASISSQSIQHAMDCPIDHPYGVTHQTNQEDGVADKLEDEDGSGAVSDMEMEKASDNEGLCKDNDSNNMQSEFILSSSVLLSHDYLYGI